MTSSAPQASRTERFIHALLFFVLIAYAVLFLYHATRLILYPYTIDYGEGYILDHAREIAELNNPYKPLSSPPWLVVNYPPVYLSLVALGVKIFGLQFHLGRLFSLVGILVTGVCLYRLTLRQTSDRMAAWIAALIWLTAYPVYNWGTHHRVDSVGLGFEALGLLFLFERNRLKTAGVFFLLALYTRQTLWVGPVAGYFFLRRYNGPRDAARWFGGLLLAGGILFSLFTLLTGGEFFRHLVVYNANKFHWKDVWVMFHNAVMQMMKVQMGFFLYALLRAITTRQWDLASFCLPAALATFLLVGKIGSATNYLFELALVSSWVTGLAFAESRVILPVRSPFRMLLPAILFLGTLFPVHIPHFYGEWKIYDWGGTPGYESGDLTRGLVERMKEIPEPVLSQDAGVALLSGHRLWWHPFVMKQLSDQKRFDPEPFHKMLREKTFTALVLPFDMDLSVETWGDWWSQFSEETAAIIHQNYRVVPLGPLDPSNPIARLRGYYSPFGTNYLYLRKN